MHRLGFHFVQSRLRSLFPRVAPRSVDDAKDDHFTVNDPIVNHIRVADERNSPDARSVLNLLCAFRKLRNSFEYTLYPPFEPLCCAWIFRSNIGQNRIKLREREL